MIKEIKVDRDKKTGDFLIARYIGNQLDDVITMSMQEAFLIAQEIMLEVEYDNRQIP